MNSIIKKCFWPLVWLRRKHDDYLRKTNPEKLFCVFYNRNTGYKLNLLNPKTLDEKIAYMEFRTDTSEWSRLSDKVRVRDYVSECGFSGNLSTLYGVWKDPKDIDFNILPQKFVIKTNNGSATNIIINNKRNTNLEEIRTQLAEWLKVDYGYNTAQPHYSHISPLILAEEFLEDKETTGKGKMLIDYKFYCVEGKPLYVQVMSDRIPNTHNIKIQLFDMDWVAHPNLLSDRHTKSTEDLKKPVSFLQMYSMAEALSKPFKFVRVDLYEINSKPIFGEMSFTPGFDTASFEFRQIIGEKINL